MKRDRLPDDGPEEWCLALISVALNEDEANAKRFLEQKLHETTADLFNQSSCFNCQYVLKIIQNSAASMNSSSLADYYINEQMAKMIMVNAAESMVQVNNSAQDSAGNQEVEAQ